MAKKNKDLSDAAKKMLAKAKAEAAAKAAKAAKAKKPVAQPKTQAKFKTESTPSTKAPKKSAKAIPIKKDSAQAMANEMPKSKSRIKKAPKKPVVAALPNSNDSVKEAVMKDVKQFVAQDGPPPMPKKAKMVDSIEKLGRDIPGSLNTVEEKLARQEAMKGAKTGAMEAIESGAVKVAKKSGMGKRIAKLAGAGMLGGAVGIGLDALMESLSAEDAGDADADSMNAAEMRQREKTAALIKTRKATDSLLPAGEVNNKRHSIKGKVPVAPKPKSSLAKVQSPKSFAKPMKDQPKGPAINDTVMSEDIPQVRSNRVEPKSDKQLGSEFDSLLKNRFQGQGEVYVPNHEAEGDDDDLTKLMTEVTTQELTAPGKFNRKGLPKNVKRPVQIKTRSIYRAPQSMDMPGEEEEEEQDD